MEGANLIRVIIEGGSIGVAVLVLIIMYLLFRMGLRLVSNHFVHFAELLAGIGEKLDRLIDATERRNGDHHGRSD